jgi:uncharacterized RmlC-like cupin family protein
VSARAVCAALCGVALALALAASADPGSEQTRLSPTEIANMGQGGAGPGTSGIEGIRTTALFGDPARSGPYTIEIRVPPHTRIAAHTHRDRRSAVVVSGQWFFGYGAALAEDRLELLPAGSFYTEPANDPHFALTRDQPAVVYITGDGPTDTHFTETR